MVFASTLYILIMKIVKIIKIKEFLVKSYGNVQLFSTIKKRVKKASHSNDSK